MGGAERLAKETFRSPAARGSKKESDRAIPAAAEAVRVPAHLAPPGSPQAKQLRSLHAHLSPGQSCHRQKSLTSMRAGSLWPCPTLYGPVDGLRCQGGGFSRQEHWSVLANAGCHMPLEHCIPAALAANPLGTGGCQNPCDPSSCGACMLSPRWGRAAQAKRGKAFVFKRAGSSESLRPCRLWPDRLLRQSGVLQARTLECISQYWLPCLPRAPYFLQP